MHLIMMRVELKTISTVDVKTYLQNYHDSAMKVANWQKRQTALYSNHVTTCGPIAASFLCYKSATSMLICCPTGDKMLFQPV